MKPVLSQLHPPGRLSRFVQTTPKAVITVAAVALTAVTAGSAATLADTTGLFPPPVAPVETVTPAALGHTAFTVYPDGQTQVWLRTHPTDPRTPLLRRTLGLRPSALWLAGSSRDAPNLASLAAVARRSHTTALITLYNIPGRDDGLSGPNTRMRAPAYRNWVDAMVRTLGATPAAVVIEPDALWFIDRQFGSDRTGFNDRIASLRYAVARFAAVGAHVYVEAGTASGSVTPYRMADLLRSVGVSDAVGFAVNVSSFAPRAAISDYAGKIRMRLRQLGVADPRYVVDTSRNGNPRWNGDWCNPADRRIGTPPTTTPPRAAPGLDADLWVKAPGTSDGDCGVGRGSTGGDFLPAVATAMVS